MCMIVYLRRGREEVNETGSSKLRGWLRTRLPLRPFLLGPREMVCARAFGTQDTHTLVTMYLCILYSLFEYVYTHTDFFSSDFKSSVRLFYLRWREKARRNKQIPLVGVLCSAHDQAPRLPQSCFASFFFFFVFFSFIIFLSFSLFIYTFVLLYIFFLLLLRLNIFPASPFGSSALCVIRRYICVPLSFRPFHRRYFFFSNTTVANSVNSRRPSTRGDLVRDRKIVYVVCVIQY